MKASRYQRRVVVTGIGLVTPLGCSVTKFWNGVANGRSGVSKISSFDAANFPVRIAAEVKGFDSSSHGISQTQSPNCPRQTLFSLAAGLDAARDAGVLDAISNPRRAGVYLGCGEPFQHFETFTDSVRQSAVTDQPLRIFDPELQQQYTPNMPAVQLAAHLNTQGPTKNCIAACVSATQAIGQSMRMIRRGDADMMFCGGAHSCVHEFGLTGFNRLSALSVQNEYPEQASRPFDRERDGFVVGEGAAVLVAEELGHARARGARIYGEITGFGSAQDAFRVTDTHPDGRGTVNAMTRALKDSGLGVDDIDYINAHGTSTSLNDKVETRAIRRVFRSAADSVSVSSTKSMIGHATTACGGIELAACLLTMQSGIVPPTINLENSDPDCDLDYVPNIARSQKCQHVLSNNIGFGGQNAAIVVSRFSDGSAQELRRAA